MDRPGKIANPARGQLNRENICFPVPVRGLDFSLARRVRPSCPASTCSFSILRLNLVGIPPEFRYGIHFYRQPPSGQSRVHQITSLRTDGDVHSLPRVGRVRPVVLKVVGVTGLAYSGSTMAQFLCASLFPDPLLVQCVCVCVCVFIKLHITTQSRLVILVILCHSR